MTKLMIIKLIQTYSLMYGVDPKVAISVAAVESQFDSQIIGMTGDVGVFQLRPSSFPSYSIKQLQDPKINIELGIKYLAQMKKQCKYKDDIDWLLCYNVGVRKANTIKHASLFPYVKKVKLVMNERKF
jgi:soluble lytic murein transglycosylase-like protein